MGHELPASYKDFLFHFEEATYLDRTCDVYADPEVKDRLLYNFQIKKFLTVNPSGSEDLMKNYQNFKNRLPIRTLLPIAFDQFRNIMCLDMATGRIYFWDIQHTIESSRLEGSRDSSRLFYVAKSFLDFKDRLYKVSKFT